MIPKMHILMISKPSYDGDDGSDEDGDEDEDIYDGYSYDMDPNDDDDDDDIEFVAQSLESDDMESSIENMDSESYSS